MIRKKRALKKPAPTKAPPKALKADAVVQLTPGTPAWDKWLNVVIKGLRTGRVGVITWAPKIIKLDTCAAVPESLPASRSLGHRVAWKNNCGHGHTLRFPGEWPFVEPREDIKVYPYSLSKAYTVKPDAGLGPHKYMISDSPGPGEPDIDIDP